MINLNIPLNSTSLGQVSYNLFKAFDELGEDIAIVPIGNASLSCFEISKEQGEKIQEAVNRGSYEYDRDAPTFKLWHINGLRDAVGRSPHAMTFHETSTLTSFEAQILRSLDKIYVSSKYSKEVFAQQVPEEIIKYVPLGFDSDSFKKVDLPHDDTIVFGLRGKLEKRKHTLKVLSAWVKRFGGDPRYRLDCSIFNPFYQDEEQTRMIFEALPNGEKPFNLNILPNYPSNAEYNQCLNAADIDLTGMSGCEGFNLPLFQSLCLGKHAVVLNAHVHKDFCNEENSILVEPSGTILAEDNKFFIPGQPINQGRWFDFEEDELVAAMEKAAAVAKTNNDAGEKLKDEFTFKRMAKEIRGHLSS